MSPRDDICGDVYRETTRSMVFRDSDEEPGYEEIVKEFACQRPKGHLGDHTGTGENSVAIWRYESRRVIDVAEPAPLVKHSFRGPLLIVLGILLFILGTWLRMQAG